MSGQSASALPDHYRFEEAYDENGVILVCRRYVAVAETPMCYRVMPEGMAHFAGSDPFSKSMVKRYSKLVPKESVKRFCYPTKAEAFESFLQRKRRHIQRLEFSLDVARAARKAALEIKEKPEAIEAIGAGSGEGLFCGRPDVFNGYTFE